jgi:hypothetical protein
MDNDFDSALDRLGKLEAETAGATEQRLAAEHRKILHELRRDWLTTVCKSVFVALVTVVTSLALLGEKKNERDSLEGDDRS